LQFCFLALTFLLLLLFLVFFAQALELIAETVLSPAYEVVYRKEKMFYIHCTSRREYFLTICFACYQSSFVQPWDVTEQRRIIDIEREDLEKNAQGLVTEMVYAAAYTDSSPLGRPLFCPARNTHKIGANELTAFTAENYTANRMVLAAAGVDHDELVCCIHIVEGETSKRTKRLTSVHFIFAEF